MPPTDANVPNTSNTRRQYNMRRRYNFEKRKAKFGRENLKSRSPSPEIIEKSPIQPVEAEAIPPELQAQSITLEFFHDRTEVFQEYSF